MRHAFWLCLDEENLYLFPFLDELESAQEAVTAVENRSLQIDEDDTQEKEQGHTEGNLKGVFFVIVLLAFRP